MTNLYQQKANLLDKLNALKSLSDFLILITELRRIRIGKEFSLSEKDLRALANHNQPKRYYSFTIKKRNGGSRLIQAPKAQLKHLLQDLNMLFNSVGEIHDSANGFTFSKSIVSNAQEHVGKNYVYNIDLKDFFHSFNDIDVKNLLYRKPFDFNNDKSEIAYLISKLTTHSFKEAEKDQTVLPQGSPASPSLTNLLCLDMDRQLSGLAKRFGANYTRYADDITFSSDHNIYKKSEFINELKNIIETEYQFKINNQKTRLQKNGYRKEVTGIVVNEKLNVSRRFIKELRKSIYLWDKYGYKKSNTIFQKEYSSDKAHVKASYPNMENVISGKLEFLKMVKGAEDSTFKKVNQKFNNLVKKEKSIIKKERLKKKAIKHILENKFSEAFELLNNG